MKLFKSYVIIFCAAVFSLLSCHQEKEPLRDDALVKLHGKTLTTSELKNMIPDKMSEKDSAEMADKIIQKWINDELLYWQAVNSLKDSSGIKKKVRDFRKQMYIYEYKSQYIDNKLDTVVSHEEAKAYYEDNLEFYVLDRLAVKAHYMVMDAKIPAYYRELDKVRRAKPDKMDILYDAIKGTNKTIVEHNDRWIYFDDLLKEIQAVDSQQNLRQKAVQLGDFAVEDSVDRYIVKINEKLFPGDTMPVDLIENRISHIIINKRKQNLITDLKNQLLQDAKSSDVIVINEK